MLGFETQCVELHTPIVQAIHFFEIIWNKHIFSQT